MQKQLIDKMSMQSLSGDINVINAYVADMIFLFFMRYGELAADVFL